VKKISKFLSLILSVIMIAGLFGCAKQEATVIDTEKVYSESIPLGGGLEDVKFAGLAPYGEYKEIDPPAAADFDGVDETHVYECLDCDTPYIITYRWKKNGQTLEDATEEAANEYSYGYYYVSDVNFAGADKSGCYCGSYKSDTDGKYYFFQSYIMEDGDDFVEIEFDCKSTDIQLGNSNKYISIPAGYTDANTDDDIAHGAIVAAEYDDSYFFPSYYIGKFSNSYDYAKWYWGTDELPFSEEDYKKWLAADVSEEQYYNVYEAFGYEVLDDYCDSKDDCEVQFAFLYNSEEDSYDENFCIVVDRVCYDIWESITNMDYPSPLGRAIIDTLHTIGEPTEEVFTDSIPLGGNAGELPITGPIYGEYVEVPATIYDGILPENTHKYYCEDCDRPYIMTYRWAKNGKTLEEVAKEESELYSDSYYQIVDASDWGGYVPEGKAAYFYTSAYKDDDFNYVEFEIFEDGDDIVEIVFVIATEEVEIGDSGVYIYVPTGFEDKNTADEAAYGQLFYGAYADDYYIPDIWISKFEPTYEWMNWWWNDIYPDGIPYTEAEYKKDQGKHNEYNQEALAAFYKNLGADLFYQYNTTVNGVDAQLACFEMPDEGTLDTETILTVNDEKYVIWTSTANTEFHPIICKGIINSLHRK